MMAVAGRVHLALGNGSDEWFILCSNNPAYEPTTKGNINSGSSRLKNSIYMMNAGHLGVTDLGGRRIVVPPFPLAKNLSEVPVFSVVETNFPDLEYP
jgi:hypothetical protein